MKHLFKSLAVFVFVFTVFACQNDSSGILDGTTSKHDNARTNADFYASGTMTVPAGTYESIIIAANSNITLANGVKFDQFNYGGVNITITVPTGATVTHYQDTWIPTGVTLTNYGAIHSNADFLVGATVVNNIGKHNIDQSLILDYNSTYNHSLLGTFTAWRIWVRQDNAKFVFLNNSTFMVTATATTIEVTPEGGTTPAFSGKGKLITGGGSVETVPLTGSTTTKICTSSPITFSNGGSFGIGYYGC